ncbi:MAG TPA: hypothetical protein VJ597_07345 [Sphingomicrobium sp.]|nr:hypothetical protein [Sphingomicrobium sp.]
MEPERGRDVHGRMRKINPALVALLGGIAVLILVLVLYFASRNPDQDKLIDPQLTEADIPDTQKLCGAKATSDLMKRELFRRASELRGSDHDVYSRLAAYAALRMENPVMEGEDASTGAVNCSASVSLDLPPGVAVAGGRRTLTANVDYNVEQGGGLVLTSADGIIAPLATLARVSQPAPSPETNMMAPEQPEANVAAPESAAAEPGPVTAYPGRPSFNCDAARTRGEIAVCQDSGLSALDVNMSRQFRRALAAATPEQRAQLQSSRDRFLAYRDRCPDRRCMGDAYVGRMREIRDIMEGRWQPR